MNGPPQAAGPNPLLAEIERWVLPSPDERLLFPPSQRSKKDLESTPDERLDEVLYRLQFCDHLRTMQIMYRDSEDEQRLAPELRDADAQTAPLPTKALMEKLLEGRCRVVALCRMCRGDESVEGLRALVDLAGAYALQGMWPQVHEHIAIASQQLTHLSAPTEQEEVVTRRNRGRTAAARVDCCFRVLRAHALANRGQITSTCLREVLVALSELATAQGAAPPAPAPAPAPLSPSAVGSARAGGGGGGDDGLTQATEITTELHEFMDRFMRGKKARPLNPVLSPTSAAGGRASPTLDPSTKPSHKIAPSWGDVVNFLREDCSVMKGWARDMDHALLPQNKAALHLPFRVCDEQKRGAAHPAQYAAALGRFAGAAKVVAGTTLAKQLQQVPVEVPLLIDKRTGNTIDISASGTGALPPAGTGTGFTSIAGPHQGLDETAPHVLRVVYELPVLWEEVLAKHLLEADSNPVDVLRAQVLTIHGVAQVFSNKLEAAEENLKNALKQMEKLGLEMEVTACELYNSIAQLMITKHRKWDEQHKTKLKKQAHEWILVSEEGRLDVKRRVEAIKKHYAAKGASYVLSDIETRAKNASVKSKMKKLTGEDDGDPTRKAVEAAYRYLVRAHEILETAHGPVHAGVATACLAVASVQNILGAYEESRDWLIKATRCMERLEPLPVRALAFVQLQLSQVLSKQGYEDESLNVMARAADFHRARAQEGLLRLTEITPFGPIINSPPRKGDLLFDDINMAVDLISRMVRAHAKAGRKAEAAALADSVGDLVEAAFDWDSLMTAEARREAGERYAAAGDWTNACLALRKSLEALETVCGRGDRRTAAVAKLLNAALENRLRTNQHHADSNGGYAGADAESGGGRPGEADGPDPGVSAVTFVSADQDYPDPDPDPASEEGSPYT